MHWQVMKWTWRVYSLRRDRAQGGARQDIISNDGVKLSKQKYTPIVNRKNCNAEIFLTVRVKTVVILFSVLYTWSTATVLEATDVWLKTFDPAAFMAHVRNELQALGAHPDLEDTASTGGMAVLLLKLCSCKLKCGNGAQCCTLLWPHYYLWSGKPDSYSRQIIRHPRSKVWGYWRFLVHI